MKNIITVYHAYKQRDGKIFFGKIGKIFADETVTPETVWHLCNHGCWCDYEDGIVDYETMARYQPMVGDRGFVNDDIFFQLGDTWYAAKMCGWEKLSSFDEAKAFILENALWLR
jgi:hypothetical protein